MTRAHGLILGICACLFCLGVIVVTEPWDAGWIGVKLYFTFVAVVVLGWTVYLEREKP